MPGVLYEGPGVVVVRLGLSFLDTHKHPHPPRQREGFRRMQDGGRSGQLLHVTQESLTLQSYIIHSGALSN